MLVGRTAVRDFAIDRDRVERALLVWQQHGHKPSTLKPVYQPLFKKVELQFLSPPLEVLYERINARTHVMINEMGWIDESRDVYAEEQNVLPVRLMI